MKAAALQLNAVSDRADNERRIARLVREAAAAGAGFIALPEVAWWRGAAAGAKAEPVPGPATAFCSSLAVELGVWIHGGTVAESSGGEGLPWNTAFVIGPDGSLAARYRKIHLFDIDRPDLRLLESESFARGKRLETVLVGDWTAGLVICYDLRFPELWQALRARGADLFVCPANFTAATGEAHWEVLLRARAVETQSYVLAPAQWGRHPDRDFHAFGRALVVDPWGRVVDACDREGDGFALADLDPNLLAEVRRSMPVAAHRRPDLYRA